MVTSMIKKNHIIVFISVILSTFILFSCVSTDKDSSSSGIKKTSRIKNISYSSMEEEPFYSQNQDSFIEKKLSNGIPVIIKKSRYQSDCGLRLVIDTVPLSKPVEQSGLELITLNLMKKGTAKYSSLYISNLEYTDSTKFTVKVHPDYLEYGIISQNDSLISMIDVLAATYKFPSLDLDEFEKLSDKENCQNYFALDSVYENLLMQDLYFAPQYLSAKSRVLYKDAVQYFKELQNASRIKIIASGNFSSEDVQNLTQALEKNFSSLKSFSYKRKIPAKKDITFSNNSSVTTINSNKENYVTGLYFIPYPLSDDYLSYGILSLYLDDLISDFIRSKNLSAQDGGTGVLTSSVNIGLVSVYDADNSDYLIQNLNQFLDSSLTDEYIHKKLESYKRIYTSFVMSSELNCEKTLNQMALSLVYCQDAKAYIQRPYKISKISPGEIRNQFDSCINGKVYWFTASSMTK